MPEQPTSELSKAKLSELEQFLAQALLENRQASVQMKLEDEATRQANVRRAEWQLQRDKVIFYTALCFTSLAAVGSTICLFLYSDSAGRRTAAFTILTSILAALLGYLTGLKAKSDKD